MKINEKAWAVSPISNKLQRVIIAQHFRDDIYLVKSEDGLEGWITDNIRKNKPEFDQLTCWCENVADASGQLMNLRNKGYSFFKVIGSVDPFDDEPKTLNPNHIRLE